MPDDRNPPPPVPLTWWQRAGQRLIDVPMDLFRGATGLGEQGPAGPTWINAGALLAAIPPLKPLRALVTAAEEAGTATKGIKAYHGSPHEFEKFDISKIGTGEGAQAYGHGLYFAEKEGVAREYRRRLSQMGHMSEFPEDMTKSILLDDKVVNGATPSNQLTPLERAALSKHYAGGLQAQAIRESEDALKYLTPGTPAYVQEAETLDALKTHDLTGRVKPFQGRMYEVNIAADPAHFLDWDTPLSEQPEAIRQAMVGAMGDVRPVKLRDGSYSVTVVSPGGDGRIIHDVNAASPEAAMDAFRNYVESAHGGEAYNQVAAARNFKAAGSGREPEAQATASEALRQAGVKGIKYYDAMSRAQGEGTRNYVIFDDALIDILRKYGILPPVVAGTLGLSQFAKPQQGQQQ